MKKDSKAAESIKARKCRKYVKNDQMYEIFFVGIFVSFLSYTYVPCILTYFEKV